MRAALCILLLAALNLSAQVTKDVRYYTTSGKLQQPLNFFWTNLFAGANITFSYGTDGSITINGGAGGGTNVLVLTNGVIVGSVGSLFWDTGVTGYVSGADVHLGVNVTGGSGGITTNVSLMTNSVYVTSRMTNLNIIAGTNIYLSATDTAGNDAVTINVNSFILTNGFVGITITNGLATISYVDSIKLTTNGNQFLGVPLSIKAKALLTNIVIYSSNNTSVALIVTNHPGATVNFVEAYTTNRTGFVIRSNGVFELRANVEGIIADDPTFTIDNFGASAQTYLKIRNNGSESFVMRGDSAGNAVFSSGNIGGSGDIYIGQDGGNGIIRFAYYGVGNTWTIIPSSEVAALHGSSVLRSQITNVWDIWTRTNIYVAKTSFTQYAWVTNALFSDYVHVSNAVRAGYVSITNNPGTQLGYLELRSTNGNSYDKFSRVDDNWKPTNYFVFSVTNPVAGQLLKFGSVTYTAGEAKIVLTNDTDNTGGGGSLSTNGNQFGAQLVLTIKEGALLTNIMAWSSNVFGTPIIVNSQIGIITNMFEIRNTNGFTSIFVDSNTLFTASNIFARGYIQQNMATANRVTIYDVNKALTNSSITDAQLGYLGVAQFTNWGLYSTNLLLAAGGVGGNIQVNMGGVLVGSTNSYFDVTNGYLNLGLDARAYYAAGIGVINITNVYLGRPAILIAGTNHSAMANFLTLDDTGIQIGKGKAIYFTFDADDSSPPNNNAKNGAGWIITNNTGVIHFYPSADAVANVGLAGFRLNEVWGNRLAGSWWVTNLNHFGILYVTNPPLGGTGAKLRLYHTNGNAYTDFSVNNSVLNTNTLVWGISNPAASQVIKIFSVSGGGAINSINLTNDLVDILKSDINLTNIIVYSSSAAKTNIVVSQFSGSAGALQSWLNSSGAMLSEINSNGFLMQTNGLTNYTVDGTVATPTNTIAYGVEQWANRNMPAWFDDKKLFFTIQPFLATARISIINQRSGTTVGSYGTDPSLVGVGAGGTTISHPDNSGENFILPYMVALDTASSDAGVAGVVSTNLVIPYRRLDGNGQNKQGSGYFFFCEWASTNFIMQDKGTTNITFIGLMATNNPTITNLVVSTNGGSSAVGLYVDARTQTNMFIQATDGSRFRTNTGINFVASNLYQFAMFNSPTSRFLGWRLKDLTARVEATGWFSNNVPTNAMRFGILTRNGTNRAHQVRFSTMYVEAPLAPQ